MGLSHAAIWWMSVPSKQQQVQTPSRAESVLVGFWHGKELSISRMDKGEGGGRTPCQSAKRMDVQIL